MKKLLIINQQQLGYHSDTYYYCKYLRRHFQINYICHDSGKPRILLPGISVEYLRPVKLPFLRDFIFLCQVITRVKKPYDIYFIKYFKGCAVLPILFRGKKFLLDIRTASVLISPSKRRLYDAILKLEASCFKRISVISKSLGRKLNLDKTTPVIPLGADTISNTSKSLKALRLIYVGTLYNRNIEETIEGFFYFLKHHKFHIDISYTIIGTGLFDEEQVLRTLVQNKNMENYVNIVGQIPHDQLAQYFDAANVGICYVPVTDYYDAQPPTKIFEYLLSGMPVIATGTSENKKIITSQNGVITQDTPQSFYLGLKTLYDQRHIYDSKKIREEQSAFTWENIVPQLHHLLNSL